MAMNRQDYMGQGSRVAFEFLVAGKLQKEGYPVSGVNGEALNVSFNGSWQAKAWREGFDSVRSSYREAQRNDNHVSADEVVSLRKVSLFSGRQVCADRARVLRRRGHPVRFSHKHASTGKAVYVWDMVKAL